MKRSHSWVLFVRWPAGVKRHPVDNDAALPTLWMNGARRPPFVWTGCVLAVHAHCLAATACESLNGLKGFLQH